MERFIRTLKEQCLYLHRFQTLDEARMTIAEFMARYNHEWLIEPHGHRSLSTYGPRPSGEPHEPAGRDDSPAHWTKDSPHRWRLNCPRNRVRYRWSQQFVRP